MLSERELVHGSSKPRWVHRLLFHSSFHFRAGAAQPFVFDYDVDDFGDVSLRLRASYDSFDNRCYASGAEKD